MILHCSRFWYEDCIRDDQIEWLIFCVLWSSLFRLKSRYPKLRFDYCHFSDCLWKPAVKNMASLDDLMRTVSDIAKSSNWFPVRTWALCPTWGQEFLVALNIDMRTVTLGTVFENLRSRILLRSKFWYENCIRDGQIEWLISCVLWSAKLVSLLLSYVWNHQGKGFGRCRTLYQVDIEFYGAEAKAKPSARLKPHCAKVQKYIKGK